MLSVWSGSKVVRGGTGSRLYIAASWRWSLMCEMISLKECLHMIDSRCLVDGWVFFCNFMLLSYVTEDLLQVVGACLRSGICSNVAWPRMRIITIGSFLSYRDAIQLYESYCKTRLCCAAVVICQGCNDDKQSLQSSLAVQTGVVVLTSNLV